MELQERKVISTEAEFEGPENPGGRVTHFDFGKRWGQDKAVYLFVSSLFLFFS